MSECAQKSFSELTEPHPGFAEALAQQDELTALRQRVAALEAQRQQLAEALEDALTRHAAERQHIQAELEQFAHAASHDLQEPLRKIQTFGNLLNKLKGGLCEEGQDYMARMQEAARRMQAMIEGLLEYSRITTRGQSFGAVDLARVARTVALDLKAGIRRMGGCLEVGSLPEVEADLAQMQQLLRHLISNGFKFRQPGETPVVKVYGRLLEDRTGGSPPRGGQCQIFVEDNGTGFEEMFLDRIFGIFQRLHGRNTYEGTGMGLPICRRIVERHGGSIVARSEVGKGSQFIVTLPVTNNLTT